MLQVDTAFFTHVRPVDRGLDLDTVLTGVVEHELVLTRRSEFALIAFEGGIPCKQSIKATHSNDDNHLYASAYVWSGHFWSAQHRRSQRICKGVHRYVCVCGS